MSDLKQVCYNNFNFRNIDISLLENKIYKDRLEEEISVIAENGFAKYMFIIADLVNWVKRQGWFVNVRGSGSGSLVSYLLGLTEIDPLKYGLSFARFLNKARIGKGVGSFPDIDVDISKSKRQNVLDYLMNKYGKDRVFLVSNYTIFTLNQAIRKVFSAYTGDIEHITINTVLKHTDFNNYETLEEILESDNNYEFQELYKTDKEFQEICTIANKLVGKCCNFGIHAAAVVVFDEPIHNICPISVSSKEIPVIQCDKKDVEKIGGIKLDLLGLATGDIIHETFTKVGVDWYPVANSNFDDENVYEKVIKNGNTDGCFQIETSGLKDTIETIKADCFNDLVAAIALYRPGSKDYIGDYAEVKLGGKNILDIKPYYKDILDIVSETYGVILYQEQSMAIAQKIAGFTDSEADVLRKAIGKKDKELMAQCKKDFLANANDKENAMLIWEVMEKSGDYSFNKSHAVAYAQNAYLTAWLKTYYPKEFMVSLLNYENNEDKIKTYITNSEFKINQPSIFQSEEDFAIGDDGDIYYGLHIKGIKKDAINNILLARMFFSQKDFNIISYIDFCELDKSSYKALAMAGAFDQTGLQRSRLLDIADDLFKVINKNKNLVKKEDYEPYIEAKNSILFVDFMENPEWKKTDLKKMIKKDLFEKEGYTKEELLESLNNDYKNISLARRKSYKRSSDELLEDFLILYNGASSQDPIQMLNLEYGVLSGFLSVHPNEILKIDNFHLDEYEIGDAFIQSGIIAEVQQKVSKRNKLYYSCKINFEKFQKYVIIRKYKGSKPKDGNIIRINGKIEEYKGYKTIKAEDVEIY